MKLYWTPKNLTITMLLLITTSIANANEMSGHISGYIGMKTMNSSDWPNLDRHFSMGFNFDIKMYSWPVNIVLDLMDTGSEQEHDGVKDLSHTTEYHLGVRKIFINQTSHINPFIGGGVAYMYAELEYQDNNNIRKENDRDVGGWLGAGMYYEIATRFTLGVDVRYSYGKVVLFNTERDAGGISTGITIGYQF